MGREQMHKEYDDYQSLPTEDDVQINEQSLPSRKKKHPKPTSFLERPTFTFIIFVLFILVLAGILLYYYYKDNDSSANTSNQNTQSNSALGANEQTEPANSTSTIPKHETVPVVEIKEPDNPTDKANYEEAIENKTDAPKKEVIHIVVENDTLYRLAITYYGKPEAKYIDQIKEANGLKDYNIIKGTELIIPEPLKTP